MKDARTVFARGGKLYGHAIDTSGRRRQVATGIPVGREDDAQRHLAEIERAGIAPVGVRSRWHRKFINPVASIADAAAESARHIESLCPVDGCGYVYAIQSTDGGPIKIGSATDPSTRLAEIQRMNPAPLVLLGLSHGGMPLELALHGHYIKRRIHGEWFLLDENPLPIGVTCLACSPEWIKRLEL